MDPLLMLIGMGLIGGLGLSMYLMKAKISASEHAVLDASGPNAPTDVINMAHIRVAGAGGLGLVIMAVAVAIFVPGVREAMLLAIVLGGALAFALIRRHRRTGPMPSSGQKPGANTMLSIDDPDATAADEPVRPARRQTILPSGA
jgi:hypothetical protein